MVNIDRINILPTIVSSGHILIQSDNAHSSAKRGRSEVLINGKVVEQKSKEVSYDGKKSKSKKKKNRKRTE